ncbi:hypothetical protein ACT691_12620 [Vibrio metschnikovii]
MPLKESVAIVQSGTQNAQALSDQVGFTGLTVEAVDTTDGLRITLSDNSIFHLRPSGNALNCVAIPRLRAMSRLRLCR